MEDFENKQPVQPTINDLQAQLDSLRHMVISVLVLLIVVSGTFNLYLLRQVKYARLDLKGVRPQAAAMLEEYNRVNAPLMQEFLKKITEYSKTHPDFTPTFTQYAIPPPPITGRPPASTTSPAGQRP